MTEKFYTTKGDIRGFCGHNHVSIETATKCLVKDQKSCKKQGGYSDRFVVYSDGSKLSEYDFNRASILEDYYFNA